mgnify:CR=1 FL=1
MFMIENKVKELHLKKQIEITFKVYIYRFRC